MMDLEEQLADLRSLIPNGEHVALDEIRCRAKHHRRRRRAVVGLATVVAVVAVAAGSLALRDASGPRSEVNTVGPSEQPVPKAAHLRAGYLPDGLTLYRSGLEGSRAFDAFGGIKFFSTTPLPRVLEGQFYSASGGAYRYILIGADVQADYPPEFFSTVAADPTFEHLDVGGRQVTLWVRAEPSLYAKAFFVERGVVMWAISAGVSREHFLQFLRDLTVDVRH